MNPIARFFRFLFGAKIKHVEFMDVNHGEHGGICGDDRLPPVTGVQARRIEADIIRSGAADANAGPIIDAMKRSKRVKT